MPIYQIDIPIRSARIDTEDDAEQLIVNVAKIYGLADNHATLQHPLFGRSGRVRAICWLSRMGRQPGERPA